MTGVVTLGKAQPPRLSNAITGQCAFLNMRVTPSCTGRLRERRMREGVGLGVGNEGTRKHLQYQLASAEPPKADMSGAARDVRFGPKADSCTAAKNVYSITSSAMAITPGGMVRPSDLAVLRLITRSYLVGCWTGNSATFAPLRIRSTYDAAPL